MNAAMLQLLGGDAEMLQLPGLDGPDYISWMRREFTAANHITDLLLCHLKSVGDPGEYDEVFAAVKERRQHWQPILYTDELPTVDGIKYELNQALWRRRQALAPPFPPPPHPPPPQLLRHRGFVPPSPSPRRPSLVTPCHHRHDGNRRPDPSRPGGKVITYAPMVYTTTEFIDGKPVNTVEGLTVYESFIELSQLKKIVEFALEKKHFFRQGGLTVGQTVVLNKRPLRCHGSLAIQLGSPIVEGHIQDKNQRETRVEAIPGFLQALFDRLFQQGIVYSKPDYCVIDFYFEGEYSRPHQPSHRYGRPLFTICLTDCEMVFGHVITGERGNTSGPLKLTLSMGSLVVLQGRSAEVAQKCIPASSDQRVLMTFGKSVPREVPEPTDGPRHVSPSDGVHGHALAPPVAVAAPVIPFPAAVPLAAQTYLLETSPRPVPRRLPVLDHQRLAVRSSRTEV